jgi:2-polyprenyl-3-methyl-5-hydroxy-6-metoxy-1,4-benzoquinol methylase
MTTNVSPQLFDEENFAARAKALDALEFDADAAEIRQRLEAVDARLFERLRPQIRNNFRELVDRYVPRNRLATDDIHYDLLDTFVNGLLLPRPIPIETEANDPEMVPYQQTPSRYVFDMVDREHITANDVFVDIGSGLGQVAILVNLLTGASVRGIEVDAKLCDYAATTARELGLTNVRFENVDARAASYDEGTVFFMYKPFTGSILAEVMKRLRLTGGRIITRG